MHWTKESKAENGVHKVRNVYVLRTHVLTELVRRTFIQMQEQLGKSSVFILFDETNGRPDESHTHWNAPEGVTNGPAIITISEDDCTTINALHTQGSHGGSMHRVEAHVHACYTAIRQPYDYLWFIEYDVYCKDFRAALQPFDKVQADMLTKASPNWYQWFTRRPWINRKWFWWDKLEGEMAHVPMRQRRGCFFPINRFSKKFLSVLEHNLSISSGYCEVYFPTLCHINGLRLTMFPPRLFGKFRFKPNIGMNELSRISSTDIRLYHPVKLASLQE